ncbi:MAG: hypothetical protein R3E45_01315 [Rhodocyclaceae bacterium]
MRLPTEDEWNRIYDHVGLADVSRRPRQRQPASGPLGSSCPVTLFAHGELFDVVGVWRWCETPTYPFDSRRASIDDFTPTDDRHAIIKGGSWITGNESRHAARHLPPPLLPACGLSLHRQRARCSSPASCKDRRAAVAIRRGSHYGDEAFGVPNFPKALADIAISAQRRFGRASSAARARPRLRHRARELRAGAPLRARGRHRLLGAFIQAGAKLAETGALRHRADEGELVSYHERRLDTR